MPTCRDWDARGMVAAVSAIALLFAFWYLAHNGIRLRGSSYMMGVGVFVLLSIAALYVGPIAPNGICTYGGKAKLILSCGGIPNGFWTADQYTVFQPAYPPGMTVVAMLIYCLSGGIFGTVWIQLVVPAVFAMIYIEMNPYNKGWDGFVAASLVCAFILSPLTLRMAVGFYAEPVAALLVLVGLNAIRADKSYRGWFFIGAAGLFRPEGLLIAGILWGMKELLGESCGFGQGGLRRKICSFFLALMPGFLWQLMVYAFGAKIQGFSFDGLPQFATSAQTLEAYVVDIFTGADLFGAVGLLTIVLVFKYRARMLSQRRMILSIAFLVVACAVGAVVMGFNRSSNIEWVLTTHAPRYLWLAFAPLVSEIVFSINVSHEVRQVE